MKITPLLIGACLVSVVTGCHKPQTSQIIGAAETAVETTALASIAAKYPDVSLSDLKFSNLNIEAMPNGQQKVFVTYDIQSSAKTTTEGNNRTTTTDQIGVRMSLSGEVEDVYKSKNTRSYSVAR
jgi:hypothetical protein